MLQFYFLSIMLNLVTGLLLVFGKELAGDDTQDKSADRDSGNTMFGEDSFFDDKTFRLVLGILTVFTGVMKFMSVVHDDVPVAGDLIPALAGLLGGICLIIEYARLSGKKKPLNQFVYRLFVEDRKYIGWFSIGAAVLHFIFPEALLL